MGKTNYSLSQGISFEIMTDIGVPKEAYLECETAIAAVLLKYNNEVRIHPTGHYNLQFERLFHLFKKDSDIKEYYL